MADNTTSSFLDKLLYKFYPGLLYKKTTYSQLGEDLLIKSCMEMLGLKQPRYIDIGAHHPYYLNNTALLYSEGLSGINVEPDPDLFSYFAKFRKRDMNLNMGVGTTKGEQLFYTLTPNTLSTFSESEAKEYEKMGSKILKQSLVKIDTVPNIVNAYNNGRFPEILSIDVEGLDYIILQSLDLSVNYPKIICAETKQYNPVFDAKNKDHALIQLIVDKGYTVFADTFVNTVFYKK